MTKRKKKNPPNEETKIAVIENTVLHIKEKVDEFCDQMNSVEKNLIQVSLNKQNINTLKNNVKNINDTRIPKIKKDIKDYQEDTEEKLEKKPDKFPFYLILFAFTVLNGIISYLGSRF